MRRSGVKKVTVEQDVFELALERIERAYKLFDQMAVMFSGGKDSTAVLQMTLEVARRDPANRLPLDVIFYDEECIPPETIEYVERVRGWPEISLRWLALPVRHRNGCSRRSPWWRPFDPECPELWTRNPPAFAIRELDGFEECQRLGGDTIPLINHLLFDAKDGMTGLLMGIRADESLMRYRSVTKTVNEDNYISLVKRMRRTGRSVTDVPHVQLVKPIYDWTTDDVWMAPHLHGWDYNRAYDLMEKLGMGRKQQRIAPPFGEEPMQNLYMFARCWPDQWDRMAARVPGAATAARYAKTKLYGYGPKGDMRKGRSWRETIEHFLDAHSETTRGKIATRIRKLIEAHKRKTDDPIPDDTAHSLTGLSWKFLAMVAQRGDLKGRKSPLGNLRGWPKEELHR